VDLMNIQRGVHKKDLKITGKTDHFTGKYISLCMYVCMYVCIYIIYMYVCMYIYNIYVSMYIYIYVYYIYNYNIL
jgi:hypothetical protein